MTPEGDVTLPGGVKTTMKELREKGVDLYIDREKEDKSNDRSGV